MIDTLPLNSFERSLQSAMRGELAMPALLRALAETELAVPSAGEVAPSGAGFQPVLFDKDGVPMLASFTAPERIGKLAAKAPFCLVMKGRELLRRLPPDHGLVVNPGLAVGFDVSPAGVAQLLAELAAADR